MEEVVGREGISVSAVALSEVGTHVRIDAEFYQPEYLRIEETLEQRLLPVSTVAEVSQSVINFGAYSLCNFIKFQEEGVPFLTGRDIGDNTIHWQSARFISEEQHRGLLWKSQVRRGHVLVAMAGRLGFSCVFDEDFPCNSSQDVAKVSLKGAVNPIYLSTYLNSKYGRLQLLRAQTGSVQHHTNLGLIKGIRILLLPSGEQERIADIAKQARQWAEGAESLYTQAEAALTEELGLGDLDLSEGLFSVRTVSEAAGAGRLDAEYYQEKYERLLKHLDLKGAATLLSLVDHMARGVQPVYAEDGNVIVIKSREVGKQEVQTEGNERTSAAFWEANPRGQVRQFDVLLNSTGYITIGRCQCYLDDLPALCDNHVTILRTKPHCDPVFLACFLNSVAGFLQTERGWTGSSGQIELRAEVIGAFLVWVPPMAFQRVVRSLVEESHAARKRGKELLAEAKAVVERLIEEAGQRPV